MSKATTPRNRGICSSNSHDRNVAQFKGNIEKFRNNSPEKDGTAEHSSDPRYIYDHFLQTYVLAESINDGPQNTSQPISQALSNSSRVTTGQKLDRNQSQGHGSRGNHNIRQNNLDFGEANQKIELEYPTFIQLRTLSELEGNEIVFKLHQKKDDFQRFLNSTRIKGPDYIVMMLRVLAKAVQANFSNLLTNVLCIVCSSNFFESLAAYLTNLPNENPNSKRSNRFYWEDTNRFWDEFVKLFEKAILFIPETAQILLMEVISVASCCIKSIENQAYYTVDKRIKTKIFQIDRELEKTSGGNISTTSASTSLSHEIVQDFRKLSVIPTIEDLRENSPYIRPNKTKGAYDSVEHYLDVQYRLLREDFISPLRDGIREYQRACESRTQPSQISDIRVYERVRLMCPTVVNNHLGICISFGVINIDWDRSDRFMFGSLVCLSKDQFKSVLFATVVGSDRELLQKGEVIIQPCAGTTIPTYLYRSMFVMIESTTFFLPYYYTLCGLRHMYAENFPMKRYIIDAKPTTNRPKYINTNVIYRYQNFEIPVMNDELWPTARSLRFNESQYYAFKSALLHELAVIHGPPGTGKTFMSLQIARILLDNSEYWRNPREPTPMIVVCLTNHALDQFLEGILAFTKSVVRIGEQSKNPALANYKFKVLRNNYYSEKYKRKDTWRLMSNLRKKCAELISDIELVSSTVRALTDDTVIVSTSLLRQYCEDGNKELMMISDKDLRVRLVGMDFTPERYTTLKTNTDPEREVEIDVVSDNRDTLDDELEAGETDQIDNSQFYCLKLSDLEKRITDSEKKNRNCSKKMKAQIAKEIQNMHSMQRILQARLYHHPLVASETNNELSKKRDWEMYWHWVTSSYETAQRNLLRLKEEYQKASAELNDVKQMCDVEVLRSRHVIGLTTAGAARLQECLRALKSPIVIVEEAAEILEAHVICSLTEHCQHLILIGDHKQLRPKPATYQLEVNYNLNISLFERVVNMRNGCAQLTEQHRMRPEIANLLCPSIYEKLDNHKSVYVHPRVRGMDKSLYFLDHEHPENCVNNNESYSNLHEARFFVRLAVYLRHQGYGPNEITILCAYTGQVSVIKEEKRKQPLLLDVHVTTVDNYQGEENNIILLSLVRNNSRGNIGFLQTENRVCVALSRARDGLYIMGNMNNLLTRNKIWPKIKTALEKNGHLGSSLVLRCQFHNDQTTEVKHVKDFDKVALGGCSRACGMQLKCGHTCIRVCHAFDRTHEEYYCSAPCLKRCPRGHPCRLKCGKPCEPCIEETVFVSRYMDRVVLPCSIDTDEYECAL